MARCSEGPASMRRKIYVVDESIGLPAYRSTGEVSHPWGLEGMRSGIGSFTAYVFKSSIAW